MLNSTTVGWMPEPQGRGTIGLVWSCLATIFICTWSALHLSLPSKEDSASDRAREQAICVVMGLFAPEWLTYLALNDLVQALEVKRRVSIGILDGQIFCILTLSSAPNGR